MEIAAREGIKPENFLNSQAIGDILLDENNDPTLGYSQSENGSFVVPKIIE